MRVLQLPVNVASHLAVTVRGLRAAGVDARGIAVSGSSPVLDDAGIIRLSSARSRRSLRWAAQVGPRLPLLAREIREADVVHWYMTPGLPAALDLRWAARLGKPMLVEFAGSEIRNPEIESRDNPYYAEVLARNEYRAWETTEHSRRTQVLFARFGCEALVSCPSLLPYLEPGRFEHVHLVRQRIPVRELKPVLPDPAVNRPLIVHASTAPVAKGTPWILEAVDRLRLRIDLDFVLLEGVPHAQALETIARADVFVDQLVYGAHGGAAIEAMSLGKPVLGYVKPSVLARYPPEIPIVNTTRETFESDLEDLLGDGPRRLNLGRRSRAYAEEHHDSIRLAPQLSAIYEQMLARRGR